MYGLQIPGVTCISVIRTCFLWRRICISRGRITIFHRQWWLRLDSENQSMQPHWDCMSPNIAGLNPDLVNVVCPLDKNLNSQYTELLNEEHGKLRSRRQPQSLRSFAALTQSALSIIIIMTIIASCQRSPQSNKKKEKEIQVALTSSNPHCLMAEWSGIDLSPCVKEEELSGSYSRAWLRRGRVRDKAATEDTKFSSHQ